jgi:hypothetical protein
MKVIGGPYVLWCTRCSRERLPFYEADKYSLQEKLKRHEVEYDTRVSKADEMITRKASVINSTIEDLRYYTVRLLYALLFPGHVLFKDPKIFLWVSF